MGFTKIVNKLLRAGEGRVVRNLEATADTVDALRDEFATMTDSELADYTLELKQRYWGDNWETYQNFLSGEIAYNPEGEEIAGPGEPQVLRDDTPIDPLGEPLENLLAEAFALVREASTRILGQTHYKVQLMGGAALFNGNIAEMKTGEGKTLVATLPAFVGALSGLGVHVVTVNDYLASYQSELMGRVFRLVGLSTGCIISNQTPDQRRIQYNADITYGTNNEFGFDYLRDNMAMSKAQLVQRGHYFAIVDEVDSILIDEARTPLIISGRAEGNLNEYYIKFAKFANTLKRATNIDHSIPEMLRKLQGDDVEPPNGDYEVDEKKKTVGVLDSAIDKLEQYLGIDNLYDSGNTQLVQFLNNAIKAKELFTRDKDYIVANGEVKIVDEHTGRVLDGRRYSEGMHQAIEAKEGVKIQEENQTYATVTLQNYFRLYKKLSGMTGTAETEAAEFQGTYKLGVVPIPTNKPMVRADQPDFVYKSRAGKYDAIVRDVQARNELGQPVLIGTTSVEQSEEISKHLKQNGVQHNVLNAKQHAREAAIVAMAGRKGAVTVATNMAGRGTDIMLGGNSEFLAHEDLKARGLDPVEDREEYESLWGKTLKVMQKQVQAEHDEVVELGGLYVLGTERHESRRIDNQLRGRSGRQGDPGESRFYISMEDDLMRLFNSARAEQVMSMMNFPEDVPIESSMLSKSIQNAQAQVEARNFEIRKNVLKYDDVMTKQREVVYSERKRVLLGENMSAQVQGFINETLNTLITEETIQSAPEEWDLLKLWREIKGYYAVTLTPEEIIEAAGKINSLTTEMVVREVTSDAEIEYAKRVDFLGKEQARQLERQVMLSVIDQNWRHHLYEMDYLKNGIGLRAMAQKDPLVEYTNEGSIMFQMMNAKIKSDTVRVLFNISLNVTDEQGNIRQMNSQNEVTTYQMSAPDEQGDQVSVGDNPNQRPTATPASSGNGNAKKIQQTSAAKTGLSEEEIAALAVGSRAVRRKLARKQGKSKKKGG
jgi:preprotein translocase subunit SecA